MRMQARWINPASFCRLGAPFFAGEKLRQRTLHPSRAGPAHRACRGRSARFSPAPFSLPLDQPTPTCAGRRIPLRQVTPASAAAPLWEMQKADDSNSHNGHCSTSGILWIIQSISCDYRCSRFLAREMSCQSAVFISIRPHSQSPDLPSS